MKTIITPLEHHERFEAMGIRPEFVGDYICALHLPDGSALLLQGEMEVLSEPNPAWSCVTLNRAGLIDDAELEVLKVDEKRRMAEQNVRIHQAKAEQSMRFLVNARAQLEALGGAE